VSKFLLVHYTFLLVSGDDTFSANGDIDRCLGSIAVRADGGLLILFDLHGIGETLVRLGEPGLIDVIPGKGEAFPRTFVDEASVL
jgi:hypothetical protein